MTGTREEMEEMTEDWDEGRDEEKDGGLEEEKDHWHNDRDGGMRTGTMTEMAGAGLGQ